MDHSISATHPPPVSVFAIADRSDNGTEGYTFTVTFLDPATAPPQVRWLHDRLSAILHIAVSPAIVVTAWTAVRLPGSARSLTDDNQWRFFLPDAIIAPEVCYSYSPSDQLRRDLTDAFAILFAGRQQRTTRRVHQQQTPTVHLDDSVTEVADIDPSYGPRRSRRLAAAKARNGGGVTDFQRRHKPAEKPQKPVASAIGRLGSLPRNPETQKLINRTQNLSRFWSL